MVSKVFFILVLICSLYDSKIVYQFDQSFSIWRYLVKIWQLFMNFLLFSKPDSIITVCISPLLIGLLPHRDRSFLGTGQRDIEIILILHWELYLNSSQRYKRKMGFILVLDTSSVTTKLHTVKIALCQ
jgi:hypothetical protein